MADYLLGLSLSAGVVLLGVGSLVLSDSINHSGSSQFIETIVAALFLALGGILLCLQGRRALRRVSAARHRHDHDS